MTRYLLVNYDIVIGEYEVSSQSVLDIGSRQRADVQVHKYFLDFWGMANDYTKGDYYFYFDKAVKIKRTRFITQGQRKVLSDLGIA